LPAPVQLKKNTKYRLVQKMWSNMKDNWCKQYIQRHSWPTVLDETLASYRGHVRVFNQEGFPKTRYTNPYYGIGIVNFAVDMNDGCGRKAHCNLDNHSCEATGKSQAPGSPPSSIFTVDGPCTVDKNGDEECVSSPNYPSSYPSKTQCKITVPSGTALSAAKFDTEAGYDKLKVNGRSYSGRIGPSNVKVTAEISWTSDYMLNKKGWKLCQGSSLAQTEDFEDSEEEPEEEQDREKVEAEDKASWQREMEEDAREKANEVALQAAEEAGTLDEALQALQLEDLQRLD
jgi:hypothetical protein